MTSRARRRGRRRVDASTARACTNHAKLVYEDVGAWLEGDGEPPPESPTTAALGEQLRMQDEAARRLRRRRIEHGALELETVEARAVAKDGEVVDLAARATRTARASSSRTS